MSYWTSLILWTLPGALLIFSASLVCVGHEVIVALLMFTTNLVGFIEGRVRKTRREYEARR